MRCPFPGGRKSFEPGTEAALGQCAAALCAVGHAHVRRRSGCNITRERGRVKQHGCRVKPMAGSASGLRMHPSQVMHGRSDHIAHHAQFRPPVRPARYNYSAGKDTQCDEPQGFCGLQPERTSHPVLPGFTVRVQRAQGNSGTCCNSGMRSRTEASLSDHVPYLDHLPFLAFGQVGGRGR